MKQKVDFSVFYNEHDDVLSAYDLNKKVDEVFEFSEFLNVSMDKNGLIVGFEIFDASKFFEMQNPNVKFKDFFSEVDHVQVEQSQFRNNWFLVLYLKSDTFSVSQSLPPFCKEEYRSPLICSA